MMQTISRRDFVVVMAAAGGGLLLGCRVDDRSDREAFAPNAFVRIGTDGRVTLVIPQIEMGQGMYTALPMLIAEELEVGLDQITVEQAPPNEKLYTNSIFGIQATGGSTSVRAFSEPLRKAGAAARMMLVAAAASARSRMARWPTERPCSRHPRRSRSRTRKTLR
jgi:isoquinoline 1-oxidoreductase beta subunit